MKKINQKLIYILLFIIFLIFLFFLIKIDNISYGTIFIQEKVENDGNITKTIYLLSDSNLYIQKINSIRLETKQGYLQLDSNYLKQIEGLITIEIKNTEILKYPNNNVIIYQGKIPLIIYLFSNIF